MKKLILLASLLFYMNMDAQKFINDEYFVASIAIDPSATLKENSPNLVAEIGLVSYWKFVNLTVQVLPGLEGGYVDFTGAFGVNLTSDRFEQTRYYAGLRLGHIRRGEYGYPLMGFEGGFDYTLPNSNVAIGVRGTSDYRSDFKYSGANPVMRNSGFVKLTYKF